MPPTGDTLLDWFVRERTHRGAVDRDRGGPEATREDRCLPSASYVPVTVTKPGLLNPAAFPDPEPNPPTDTPMVVIRG